MIGIHDSWSKCLSALGGLRRRHRGRQAHRQKSHVDTLENLHFCGASGVTGDIDPLTAYGQNISVAAALQVKHESELRIWLRVVHRHRFDDCAPDASSL